VIAVVTQSAREFNHDVSAAKRAAAREPVVITERGRPAYVLMSIQEYQRLTEVQPDIVEWLSADDGADFDVPRVQLDLKVFEP
jgi:antitoxin Phd_YefM of type II toxin-antitoxin system